jgi:hypothetical protein
MIIVNNANNNNNANNKNGGANFNNNNAGIELPVSQHEIGFFLPITYPD